MPDFDRYVQEREYEGLLGQLASGQQTGLFHVSIYEQLRARGPDPDLAALSEAVDFCAEQIESAGDCKVNARRRSASSSCGRARCRSGATCSRRCASTRP